MMRMARLTVPLGLAAALAFACRGFDGPTNPGATRFAPGVAARSTVVSSIGDDTVLIIKRLSPLNADVSESAVIGPAGGEIRIPASGGKIRFPAGALSAPTLITMTAKAGWDAAYEFAPHGIRFAVPVEIEQNIQSTIASRYPSLADKLTGSYYQGNLDDDYVDSGHLNAHVTEVHGGVSDHTAHTFTFYINHFSGWAISTGRSDVVDY